MPNEETGVVINTWFSAFSEKETGATLLLVESGGFACSVLREWGFRPHYPIAIISDCLEIADELAKKLGAFQSRTLNLNMPPSELSVALKSYHDDVVLIQFSAGRYSAENLETVLSLCMRGESEFGDMKTVIVIVFEQVIPEDYEERFSLVLELKSSEIFSLNRSSVVYMMEILKQKILNCAQTISYEINKNVKGEAGGRDLRFWAAVAIMVAFTFQDEVEKTWLCNAIKKAYKLAEFYEFKIQIPVMFRRVLDEAIPNICSFMPEASATELSTEELSRIVLFDETFYYISSELFDRICEPLKSTCTINQIKDALADADVLCSQGKGNRIYRTIKKKIGNQTLRFVWLKRKPLEDSLEMSLVDTFKIREKKHDKDSGNR